MEGEHAIGTGGFAVGVTAGVAHEREFRTRGSVFHAPGQETALFETFASKTASTLGALGVRRSDALSGPLVDGRLQVGVGF